ncbi:stage 0 sporulation family protein [Desulfurivibrio sp. D14AmB]|uniref:PSP1 domain-containing protein n=1 Tax=Desulfurivibrio sp. D14AmB TaxID=3374370 RepID=UPI00376F3AF2
MENCNINETPNSPPPETVLPRCCAIRFRPADQPCSATTRLEPLHRDELVMVQTDHGLEPALVLHDYRPCGPRAAEEPPASEAGGELEGDETASAEERNGSDSEENGNAGGCKGRPATVPAVIRRASREEHDRFASLQAREKEAFTTGQHLIAKHRLPMKLIRVERYFNGSKVIFYFTAENRVDFRELVKDLVQEFRTRVEIRQVGVRHETKMIGGIGCCGRELCCSAYIRNFSPVSIKMAKEQGLPLNPSKISGVCNRLLCCLTYEFETYQKLRRKMPKLGKNVTLDGATFKVLRVHVLEENVEVCALDDPGRVIVWQASEWSRCEPLKGGGRPPQNQEQQPEKPPEKRQGNRREKRKA